LLLSLPAQQQHTAPAKKQLGHAEKTDSNSQEQAAVLHHFPGGFSSSRRSGFIRPSAFAQRFAIEFSFHWLPQVRKTVASAFSRPLEVR
jgi:hypothetical protein